MSHIEVDSFHTTPITQQVKKTSAAAPGVAGVGAKNHKQGKGKGCDGEWLVKHCNHIARWPLRGTPGLQRDVPLLVQLSNRRGSLQLLLQQLRKAKTELMSEADICIRAQHMSYKYSPLPRCKTLTTSTVW